MVFVQEGLVATVLFCAHERAIDRNDCLFPSRKGGRITNQRADQITRHAARRGNLDRNVHAHLFRHGYAINFLNCGGRLDALQGNRDTEISTRLGSTCACRVRM